MSQSNVGIRINIDTGQARGQVEDLSRTIADLNKQLQEAAETKDWKSVAQLTQAIDSATSGRGQIMNQARQAQAAQTQAGEGFFGGQGMWVLQQSLNTITHGILNAWDAALTAAKQRASGDYTGAAVSQKRAKEEGIGQAAGMGLGALGFLLGPLVGMMTTALGGEIGKFIGGIGAKKMEENLAYSAQYKNALQGIDTLNQLYGGAINGKTADQNNSYGMELRGRAVEGARGTGLDTERFIEAMGQTATFGIKDATQALNMTRNQAMWSRFTGADLGTIQKFAGQAYRYGGEKDATGMAFAGLNAQNMGKGQFSEFLNSIERVMADGISKGYTRSTQEIAGNMALLYKLSGNNPLWQGEQGAQRYSQMSNALSNATNLQTVGDVMSFSVVRDLLVDNPETATDERKAKFYKMMNLDPRKERDQEMYTGTYLDELMVMGKGVNGDILKGQHKLLKQMYGPGDDEGTASKVEQLKTMTGLNDVGAVQLLRLMQRGDSIGWESKEFDNEKKRITESKDYKSDSQLLRDTLNDLGQIGVKIGQIEFPKTEMVALTKAMVDLEAALRGRLGTDPTRLDSEQQIILNQVTENMSNPRPGQTRDSVIEAWRIQMQPFIAAENNTHNPLAQQAASRFNHSILPMLSDETVISDEIKSLLFELEREGRGMAGGRGTSRSLDEGGLNRLNAIMDRLEVRLNTPLELLVKTEEAP